MDGVRLVAQRTHHRQPECLHPDRTEPESQERPAEDLASRCVRREVPRIVGGVERPGQVEAPRDGRHQNERTDSGRRAIGEPEVRLAGDRDRDDCEQDRQANCRIALERVDGLVADHAQGRLAGDHDQQAQRERNRVTGDDGDCVRAEERVDRVPCDRAQPVEDPGEHDRLAEREAGGGHLGEPKLRPHGAQQGNEERAHQVADDDRQDRGDEAQLEEVKRHQRPNEEGGRNQVRREPDGEDSPDRAIARVLRDRLHPMAFDRQVALARGHPFTAQCVCCHRHLQISTPFP